MAPVRAGTSHTRLNRRPDLPGSRAHTFPAALATSIAATRSMTNSCSASGSPQPRHGRRWCLLALASRCHFACPPIESIHTWVDRPGASVKGTEILTGVLEAQCVTLPGRAPAPSCGTGSQTHSLVDVGRRPESIFTPARRPVRKKEACEEIEHRANGLGRIDRELPDWLHADVAILGEPTGGYIEAGCQGVLRVVVRTTGTRTHSARASLGDNGSTNSARSSTGWPPTGRASSISMAARTARVSRRCSSTAAWPAMSSPTPRR